MLLGVKGAEKSSQVHGRLKTKRASVADGKDKRQKAQGSIELIEVHI